MVICSIVCVIGTSCLCITKWNVRSVEIKNFPTYVITGFRLTTIPYSRQTVKIFENLKCLRLFRFFRFPKHRSPLQLHQSSIRNFSGAHGWTQCNEMDVPHEVAIMLLWLCSVKCVENFLTVTIKKKKEHIKFGKSYFSFTKRL